MSEGRGELPSGTEPVLRRVFQLSILIAFAALAASVVHAQSADNTPEVDAGYLHIRDLMQPSAEARQAAAQTLIERGDPSLAAGVVDAMFWIPRPLRDEAVEVLRALTGRDELGHDAWPWVAVVGALEDVKPAPGYGQWKSVLLGQIDPRYRDIVYSGVATAIRLEEVVSGGVPVEGIPTIDDPEMVRAKKAGYLNDDESIFGVDLELPGSDRSPGGREQRAYPLRFLDWHEMLNDVIGGKNGIPVTLSYCTLCGSGVLYATSRDDGEARRFGTSGLLYRSNKLMIERGTHTLWSNLLGAPVVGEGVGSGETLRLLPHTRTSWGEWKSRHPKTLVMDYGRELKQTAARYGFEYLPGRADEARAGVSFPVWQTSDRLGRDDEIYALRQGAGAVAFPLEDLYAAGVAHATLGDRRVVVLADGDSGAVRVYEAGGVTLRRLPRDESGRLVDAEGRVFEESESELWSGELRLLRLPGHFAYWFGWYAFFPQTQVWSPPL